MSQISSTASPGPSKTGTLEYNCYQQFLEQYTGNKTDFDIKLPFDRQYVGPIELSRTNDRGRSWVAKDNIAKGTLLLVEKAYVCSSRNYHSYGAEYAQHLQSNSANTTSDTTTSNPLQPDTTKFDETVLLVSKLINLLLSHPNPSDIVKDLKVLYPRESEMEDFETFHLSDFDITNAQDKWLFNHSMQRLDRHLSHSKDALQKFGITLHNRTLFMKRIPWLIYHNAMVLEQGLDLLCYSSLFSEFASDALFIKSSFFNHDCNPNCVRVFIGDIVFVRAVRDIPSRQECCFSYIASDFVCENYRIRNFQLPFECLCDRCIAERTIKSQTNSNVAAQSQSFNFNQAATSATSNPAISAISNVSAASGASGASPGGSGVPRGSDECKDDVGMGSSRNSNNSNSNSNYLSLTNCSLSSADRVESDYDSEAEDEEMGHYEQHRIFTPEVAQRLFAIQSPQMRINEINSLLGLMSGNIGNIDDLDELGLKRLELKVSGRGDLNALQGKQGKQAKEENEQQGGPRVQCKDAEDGVDNVVHRDFLEAYTAKAMGYCELQQWDMALHCWQLCLADIRDVQGFDSENAISYATQCLLCYVAMLQNGVGSNDNNNNNNDLERKRSELLREVIGTHKVCFGGDFRLYKLRYELEIINAHYPNSVKEAFWPFVESNI